MHYMQSYRFIFASPNWMMNVLWASLAVISTGVIPVVGYLVLMGYLFEVIDHLHYHHNKPGPEADHYPDFNINRLVDYLIRGVWPFLAALVVSLPFTLLTAVVAIVGFIIAGVVGDQVGGLAALVVILLLILVLLALQLVMSVVMIPLYLRAGLSRDFGSAFSLAFVKDFVGRVGRETIISQLFLLATGFLLTIAGFIACFVGIYPAMAILFMASHYVDYELYELYLERGGEVIEIKRPAPAA